MTDTEVEGFSASDLSAEPTKPCPRWAALFFSLLGVVLFCVNAAADGSIALPWRALPPALHPQCSAAYITLDSAESEEESCLEPGIPGAQRWRHLDTPRAAGTSSVPRGNWTRAAASNANQRCDNISGGWYRFAGGWDVLPTYPQQDPKLTDRRTCGAASSAWVSAWDIGPGRPPPPAYRKPGAWPGQGPQFPPDQQVVLCFEGLRRRRSSGDAAAPPPALERWSASGGRTCFARDWDDREQRLIDTAGWEYQSCMDSVTATVIHCGDFFLWELPPPPSCGQAYCTERSGLFGVTSTASTEFTHLLRGKRIHIPNQTRPWALRSGSNPCIIRPKHGSKPCINLPWRTVGTSVATKIATPGEISTAPHTGSGEMLPHLTHAQSSAETPPCAGRPIATGTGSGENIDVHELNAGSMDGFG